MPSSGHYPAQIEAGHDWCLATFYCKRCGASQKAVASGARAASCEPGVTGISWARATERMRDLMWPWGGGATGDNIKPISRGWPSPVYSPMLDLPVYRLEDFASGAPVPFKPEDPSAA